MIKNSVDKKPERQKFLGTCGARRLASLKLRRSGRELEEFFSKKNIRAPKTSAFLVCKITCALLLSAQCLLALPASAQTAAGRPSALSLTREELASQIQDKAKQLENLDKQLTATRESLKNAKGERVNLQKELGKIQSNINQLNLNIKSDELSLQKLNLEIESLNLDLDDIRASMTDKRQAIEQLLLELQKNDHVTSNLLSVFLASASLADGVLRAQGLKNLQGQLAEDVADLRTAEREYDSKIKSAGNKKNEAASHKRDLENRKVIVKDQQQEQQTLLAETKNKESVFEQQAKELEKLQQQIANEIEALDSVLRTKIDPSLLPPVRPGVLGAPIAGWRDGITQGYGSTDFARASPLIYRNKWHNGADLGAPIGTPVFAAEDGVVFAVENQDLHCPRLAAGKYIAIKHPNNLTTLYAHLSRQIVTKGTEVKRGDAIGYVGKTGYATGPHVHFGVYASQTFYIRPTKSCGPTPQGGDLNPLGYL